MRDDEPTPRARFRRVAPILAALASPGLARADVDAGRGTPAARAIADAGAGGRAGGDESPGAAREPFRGHDDTSRGAPSLDEEARAQEELMKRLDAIAGRPGGARAGRSGGGGVVDNTPRGRAARAMAARDYAAAQAWLEEAIRAAPDNARLLLELATVQAARGDIDGAAASYRAYLERVPEDDDVRLWLAQTLSWGKEQRQRDEAEAMLTAYLDAHPGAHNALLMRARTRSWSGKVVEAVADFDAYLARHPENRAAELELATALAGSKDPALLGRAIAIYDGFLQGGMDLDILLRRARVEAWSGRIARADADFRLYTKARPEEHGVLLEHGRALSWSKERRHHDEAVVTLTRYLAMHPDDPEGFLARARARAWAGEAGGAVPDYRAYLRARPGDEAVRLELGRLLADSRRPKESREGVAILRERLVRVPTDDETRLALARALVDRSEAERAEGIALLRDYLGRHRDDEPARLLLARALSGGKSPESLAEALRIYDAYLARHPDDTAILLQRARVRTWARQTDGAVADFRAYLAVNPGDDTVLRELARALSETSSPEQSLPVFADYVARHPDDVPTRMARARAMRWSREYGDAERELDWLAAHARSPAEQDDVDVERARLYAETGRSYEAYDIVTAVVKRSPRNEEAQAQLARLSLALRSVAVTLSQFFYTDKSRIQVATTTLSVRAPLTMNFGVFGDVAGTSLSNAVETLATGRANLGGYARYKRVELSASAGPRVYERFAPNFGAGGALRYSPTGWSNLLGEYRYDDLFFDLIQPAALSSGVRGHSMSVTGDAFLVGPGLRAVARVGGRFVRPENQQFEAATTVTIRLKGILSVGYSGQYMAWKVYDPAYWSPQAFAAHLAVVRVSQGFIHPDFAYEAQALAGVAGERVMQQPEAGFGFAFGLTGAALYRPHPRVEIRASVAYSQTIREIPVVTAGGTTPAATSAPAVTEPSRYWWLLPTASVTVRF